MVEPVDGPLGLELLRCLFTLFRSRFSNPALERRVCSKLIQQRFVRQEQDVLDVVVGLVPPCGLSTGFARVDPFEDAEAAVGVVVCF